MTPAAYSELLRLARRHSRRADEAEDLLQDAMLAAVAAGRGVDAPADRRWLAGVMRKHAAFTTRGAARHRQREAVWHGDISPADTEEAAPASLLEALGGLPPALKAVAALALSGHSRRETAYLLQLSDTALRQRLRALRRLMRARGLGWPATTPGLHLPLDYGRIRDALAGQLAAVGGVFASHDPDGHLFVVRSSQTGAARQQDSASNRRPA